MILLYMSLLVPPISPYKTRKKLFSMFHKSVVYNISDFSKMIMHDVKIVNAVVFELSKSILFSLLQKYQKSVESEISQNVSDSVSNLDQEILMSIVGYVLHSLKKSSKKKCKAANHVKMSSIIESLSMKNSLSCKSFVSRHKECMEKINRGGLNYSF